MSSEEPEIVAHYWQYHSPLQMDCDSLYEAYCFLYGLLDNGTGYPDRVEVDGVVVWSGDDEDSGVTDSLGVLMAGAREDEIANDVH